jgi:hypothetical protein
MKRSGNTLPDTKSVTSFMNSHAFFRCGEHEREELEDGFQGDKLC